MFVQVSFPAVGNANGEFVLNGVVDLDGFHHFAQQAHAAAAGSVAGGSIVIHGAVLLALGGVKSS